MTSERFVELYLLNCKKHLVELEQKFENL